MENPISTDPDNRRLIAAVLQLIAALVRLFDHHGWPW